jgi:glycosyltransferase involved in cell wall biosynthesis
MRKMKQSIVCFHLLNNYSGSPFILSLSIKALLEEDFNVIVYSSKGNGFLSNIQGVDYRPILYKWTSNKFLLVFIFIFTQIQLFLIVLINFSKKKDQIFYINTILPFGAALAGRILRKKIVYHVHEHYIRPNPLQRLALCIMRMTASKVIFVSKYLKSKTHVKQPNAIVYNVLSPEFCKISEEFVHSNSEYKNGTTQKNILMVSSLKIYKGVIIFIDLAKKLPEYEFTLVAGAPDSEVNDFINQYSIPANLLIKSVASNLHPFYQKAGILVNLTIQDKCIETFGMSILEGMIYGLPIIAPAIGGPSEIVKDGINGYLIDSRNDEYLISAIKKIFNQEELYKTFSESSIQLAKKFKPQVFANQIVNEIVF